MKYDCADEEIKESFTACECQFGVENRYYYDNRLNEYYKSFRPGMMSMDPTNGKIT